MNKRSQHSPALIESGSARWKRDREEPEVRQLAVESLGKIGGAAVPELVKIVQNKGSSLRVDAIEPWQSSGRKSCGTSFRGSKGTEQPRCCYSS